MTVVVGGWCFCFCAVAVDGWRQFCELPGRARLAPTVMWRCAGWDVEDAVPYEMDGERRKKPPRPETGRWVMVLCKSLCKRCFNTPRGNLPVRTMPDHTSFTRLSTSKMSDSLAPGTAGRPVGRFYSTAVKQNLSGTSLSAATRRITSRRAPCPERGGRSRTGSSAAPRDPRCRRSRQRSCR